MASLGSWFSRLASGEFHPPSHVLKAQGGFSPSFTIQAMELEPLVKEFLRKWRLRKCRAVKGARMGKKSCQLLRCLQMQSLQCSQLVSFLLPPCRLFLAIGNPAISSPPKASHQAVPWETPQIQRMDWHFLPTETTGGLSWAAATAVVAPGKTLDLRILQDARG